ncbi:FusB/FusC family EF-G-binding protein [Psychrobacillus vulpis]|uniref:Elongation factor G-binding protein n=1 Tax=Psychrobacillus vulpis TaxID=2325572 RepID=A0A544TPK5_9BACI|nr:FusB/FusC family EF-G-binding protein [Psychrobacillus vulpis]TQR19373.1 elongation factor G-binding protein [Psychrobacillus vulpis]
MNPFIRSDQYNFIKKQTLALVNGHLTVNDKAVLNALKSLTIEKVLGLFEGLNEEQKQLLNPVINVKEKAEAEEFLHQIKSFVIPFKEISEQTVKKMFPKAKKLKIPPLNEMDFTEISYISWIDKGTNKKFLIVDHNGKLVGLSGGFKSSHKKGLCTLCNRFEEIGMFTSAIKGSTQDAFIKRGNYICQDSQKCNHNLVSLDNLNEFVELING